MKKIKNIIFIQLAVIVYSLGNIPSKLAAQENGLTFKYLFFMGLLLFSLGVYAILWQQILKKVSLTVAYVSKAVSIIWNTLIGLVLFNEPITVTNFIGAIIVMAGIVLMSTGESHE